jgi:hypothetical protein
LCKTQEVNIARLVYDAYPDSDLLPLDPDRDCRDLQSLLEKARSSDIGDTLFQFLVLGIVEGGEGTIDGAIRVIERARDDVDAVLQALIRAQDGLQPHGPPPSQSPKAPITGRRPAVRRPRHTFGYPDIEAGPVQSGHLPSITNIQSIASKDIRSSMSSTRRNSCSRSS